MDLVLAKPVIPPTMHRLPITYAGIADCSLHVNAVYLRNPFPHHNEQRGLSNRGRCNSIHTTLQSKSDIPLAKDQDRLTHDRLECNV